MLFSSWSWSSAISKLLPLSCKPSTFLQFCSLLSHFQRIFGLWESKPAMLYFERCILYFRCCMWYFMVYFVYGITKYTIKYHIQHLKYKIQRSKYNIVGFDSQDPRIRWGRDDWRKVPGKQLQPLALSCQRLISAHCLPLLLLLSYLSAFCILPGAEFKFRSRQRRFAFDTPTRRLCMCSGSVNHQKITSENSFKTSTTNKWKFGKKKPAFEGT